MSRQHCVLALGVECFFSDIASLFWGFHVGGTLLYGPLTPSYYPHHSGRSRRLTTCRGPEPHVWFWSFMEGVNIRVISTACPPRESLRTPCPVSSLHQHCKVEKHIRCAFILSTY